MHLNFHPYGRKIAKFKTYFPFVWTENNIYLNLNLLTAQTAIHSFWVGLKSDGTTGQTKALILTHSYVTHCL